MTLDTHTRTILSRLALVIGAAALLVTGADHLDEYTAGSFSVVPTIGTLFLLNFIAATLTGIGLLVPWANVNRRFGPRLRGLLALAGIGIAAGSLVGLWISETSSLFGFTEFGFRSTIIVAIVAEAVAVLALVAYLAIATTE